MLSADVIVGFPQESDEDFSKTVEFFKEQKFLHLHIFPYSKRKGTIAYEMDGQIDESVKKERLRRLSKIQEEIKKDLLENFVKSHLSVPVLFETRDGEYMHGHAPNFVEIKAKSSENLSGKIEFVKPIYTDGKMIFGEIL